MNLIAIGEILWDVFDDRRLIGGAVLNLAAHARKLGHDVTFVSAVGRDELGESALARLDQLDLSRRLVPISDRAPTGTVRVFVDSNGQPSYTIHRPAAYDFPHVSDDDLRAMASKNPRWICFGTLAQMAPQMRATTQKLIDAFPTAQRFYDINLRKDSFTPQLVRELLSQATILKINDQEVAQVLHMFGDSPADLASFCKIYRDRYKLRGVCVTRGAQGCYLQLDDQVADLPGMNVKVVDAVGAGDAFAAAFAHGVSQEWPLARIGEFANRLGALVASRAGAVPDWKWMGDVPV